jgi:hypothetical protein
MPEMEKTVSTRLDAVAASPKEAGPLYEAGLEGAMSAALDYGVAAIETSEDDSPPIPTALLQQARSAARSQVSLDTVLRRYFAGYRLFGEFVMREVERGDGPHGAQLHQLLRVLASRFDSLVAAISREYTRESEARVRSGEQRLAERLRKLLAGELLEAPELEYDLDAHHLGAVAAGPGAPAALRDLSQALQCRLLLVRPGDGTAWAWFGSQGPFTPEGLRAVGAARFPRQISIAVGEPAEGLAGWRLTHEQAQAALPIALRGADRFVRYGDVAMLAALLRDDLFATSLRELYLKPLAAGPGGGAVLRRTVRAYFASEQNLSSAAAVLGVNRHTVRNRLRTVEKRIGRPLSTCTAELDGALRLEDLGQHLSSTDADRLNSSH